MPEKATSFPCGPGPRRGLLHLLGTPRPRHTSGTWAETEAAEQWHLWGWGRGCGRGQTEPVCAPAEAGDRLQGQLPLWVCRSRTRGSRQQLQQEKIWFDLGKAFTMRLSSRRQARTGCGIPVLGDAQNTDEYDSKQHDLVGPVLMLQLLKYLCHFVKEENSKWEMAAWLKALSWTTS